ncbi:MAG: hypothetical protein ACTSR5_12380 [Promethearchaeota archaeon]
MKIIYHIQRLEVCYLKSIINIENLFETVLKEIIVDVREEIINFIFENPYNIKYIKPDDRRKHQKDVNFWRPEFELFIDLWYATSLNYKKPITITFFHTKIGHPAFSTPTQIGKCNTKYFYKLFQNLHLLFPYISDEELIQIRKQSKKYIRTRHLSEIYKEYSIYWDDEFTKKAQITVLLLRDLGLDLLTLKKIPSISFNKNLDLHKRNKYQRHHIFLSDKDKIDPNRLVLAILSLHPCLEGLAYQVIELIKERIKWTEKCPDFYLKNIKNALELWKEFLKRKNDIISNGIEYFFRKYYPDVTNRFYYDVPVGQLEAAIKQMIQDWIRDGNSIPILPKFLHNRLM